jgi:hypothetical protein
MPVKKMYSICVVPAGDVEQGGNEIVKVTVVVQGSKYIERACTLARSMHGETLSDCGSDDSRHPLLFLLKTARPSIFTHLLTSPNFSQQ